MNSSSFVQNFNNRNKNYCNGGNYRQSFNNSYQNYGNGGKDWLQENKYYVSTPYNIERNCCNKIKKTLI